LPAQLAQYERTRRFEVVGSDTGRRYRIHRHAQFSAVGQPDLSTVPMWRQDPVGTALPVACRNWEKALPDARWRAGIRGAKGRAQRQLQTRPLYR
jgi:hypothetical protein